MKTLFASISENVQFVLLCLAVTAAVVLLAWGGERLVMKKRHRLNTAHTITTVGMLAAISGVLMVIELPLFFAPPFYKLDFSELPVLICAFSLGPVAAESTTSSTFRQSIRLISSAVTMPLPYFSVALPFFNQFPAPANSRHDE